MLATASRLQLVEHVAHRDLAREGGARHPQREQRHLPGVTEGGVGRPADAREDAGHAPDDEVRMGAQRRQRSPAGAARKALSYDNLWGLR
jgi:hypothetical protein